MTAAVESTGLVQAARTRRTHLARRFVLASLAALAMSRLLGWEISMAWMVAYGATQLAEVAAFGPLPPETVRLPVWRAALGSACLFASGAIFGALSVPLWILGGPMGGVCAAFVLSAAVINGVVNTPTSRLAISLTLAPYFVYLITTPLFVRYFGGSGAYDTAIVMGAVIFFGNSAFLWKALDGTRASEAAARAESERKRAEAEAANAARTAFVATVSHELRTPISGMLAGAAELERTARDSGARSNAALISDAARMMKALLDDLLDHSKLEAGRMSVENVAFDLRAVLAQTARFWGAEARKQGLRLRVEGSAGLPNFVEGDPTRLRQILNNLISNAVKFTKQGSVTLRLSAWPAEDGAVALRFQVADTGTGMDAEQLGRLFTPFEQLDAGAARRHGGTGLGLAISRQLARLMGGHLVAFSVKDQGSLFTLALTLPLAAAADDAAPAAEPFVMRPLAPAPVAAPAPAALEAAAEA
ncbi:ATP-binding protein, partial [Caulobacter sp. 17J65-9]|uniref:sensor histidine kinase n=1 Tax=Caulobacter sp. 17J65-9 TaxID=2709382 RepID=UPI001F0955CE